jgi:hypothetical protein
MCLKSAHSSNSTRMRVGRRFVPNLKSDAKKDLSPGKVSTEESKSEVLLPQTQVHPAIDPTAELFTTLQQETHSSPTHEASPPHSGIQFSPPNDKVSSKTLASAVSVEEPRISRLKPLTRLTPTLVNLPAPNFMNLPNLSHFTSETSQKKCNALLAVSFHLTRPSLICE